MPDLLNELMERDLVLAISTLIVTHAKKVLPLREGSAAEFVKFINEKVPLHRTIDIDENNLYEAPNDSSIRSAVLKKFLAAIEFFQVGQSVPKRQFKKIFAS